MKKKDLKEHNASVMTELKSSAAAVISAVFRSLGKMNIQIKLYNPHKDGYAVNYEVIKGDTMFVKAAGKINGLKNVTDNLLEVNR